MTNKANPFLTNTEEVFELDLSGATNKYLIPDGQHKARCIDIEKKDSKAGNPMFVWTFVVLDHALELLYHTTLTPSAIWKVAEVLEALGIKNEGTIKFVRNDVVGKECIVTTETQTYEEKKRSSITKVSAIPTLKREG